MIAIENGDGDTSATTRYFGFALRLSFRYIGDMKKALTLTRNVLKKAENEQISINSNDFYPRIQQILINAAIYEALRSKKLVADANPAIWELPDEKADRDQAIFYRDLILVLISLPAIPRLLYNLCSIDGWPPAKAAIRLGISGSRAEVLLAETRALLKTKTEEIASEHKQLTGRSVYPGS